MVGEKGDTSTRTPQAEKGDTLTRVFMNRSGPSLFLYAWSQGWFGGWWGLMMMIFVIIKVGWEARCARDARAERRRRIGFARCLGDRRRGRDGIIR
jgi:hypothetical protein